MTDQPFAVPGMKPSSGVSFHQGKLAANSETLTGDSEKMGRLSTRTDGINVPWPGFGVLGHSADSAHDQARGQASSTLKIASQAIESWKDALTIADKNYTAADEKSTPRPPGGPKMPGGLGGAGGGMGGLGAGGLGGGLGAGGLGSGPKMPAGLPKPSVPDMGNPGANLPKPPGLDPNGVKPPNLPDPKGIDPDSLNPNGLNPGGLNPGGLNPGGLNPGSLNGAQAGLSDLESKLNRSVPNPNATELASFTPSQVTPPSFTTPQTGMPDIPGADANRATGYGPGSAVGTGSLAGSGSGGAPGARVPGAAGGLPMGGAPMMSMMPMGGAGQQDKRENTGSDLLRADESVWDDDEGIAPPVLGMEDDF
jgi:hypothetical protein